MATTAARHYHDATKHHFQRFARSLGYLDWATQPDPFRRFAGSRVVALTHGDVSRAPSFHDLYDGAIPPAPMDYSAIAMLLRYSLGLSAWKQSGASRWALRVNPSSGNLHPTECYIVWDGAVWHYAPREHALEERCVLNSDSPRRLLVGLTSIHWREAWKYGERAFRYCQHDAGHALAALRFAAAMLGWRMRLLSWPHDAMATVFGTNRLADYTDAEPEEPECVAVITADDAGDALAVGPAPLVAAASAGAWSGRANRLSSTNVDWPLIDEVAVATRPPSPQASLPATARLGAMVSPAPRPSAPPAPPAPSIILQRRSALGFDPRGVLRRDAFESMLGRLQPAGPPWDVLPWAPQVHLALFVHRVQDLLPGIYAYVRDPGAIESLKAAMRPEFLWEALEASPSLYLLAPIDVRATANRLSCNQDIAEDGFFSLGMIARVDTALSTHGEHFYRNLFWEAGVIGQVLYLEAEAAGARATGIGCYFDDPVHQFLGLAADGDWQSLYHFSMGLPVEDGRLTTEGGY